MDTLRVLYTAHSNTHRTLCHCAWTHARIGDMRYSRPAPGGVQKGLLYIGKHWKSVFLIGVSLFLVLSGALFLWAATLQVPDLASIQNRKVQQSVQLYDRTGTVLLYNLNINEQRIVIPLPQISANIQNATIAIEDPNFYNHRGIELTAILRALLADIIPGGVTQGGSTLTQQVVKNTLLTSKRTLTRKFKEWVLAIKLEKVLTKSQIIELYLNQAPYGGNIYGVEQASETYYNKHASDVTVPEAAYLAAVLPAPTYYSPYGPHKADLDKRKNLVLDKMLEHGYLTQVEHDDAKAAQVAFTPPRITSITAPHFVFYVQQYLQKKYGQDTLEQSGWKVTTSLNADLQAKAEAVVAAHAASNQKSFNASNTGMVAIDPQTGQILVMVGSRNYFDKEIDGNFNVTLASRQPGSAFKPFAYAEAFEKGYTPETVVFDVPTQFSTNCVPTDFTSKNGCYSPVNYDNQFVGPISLRDAIAQSRNIPSIKALYLAGIPDTLRLAKSMGISTLSNSNQYGLTLVLGGGEVTPLDMTGAYATFANNGIHFDPVSVLQIKDASGNILEDNTQQPGNQVLPTNIAENINDILSDPVARAPLGENDLLSFPGHDVAVKTGTTNNYKDAWTIGYTPDIAVGIWAGNNDNTPMVKKVSGFIVGPMWHEFMQYALSTLPNTAFTRADTDTSNLKPILRGIWKNPGTDGAIHDILYWVHKNDPNGPIPSDPNQDPQFKYWDGPVQAWAVKNGAVGLPPLQTATSTATSSSPTPTSTNTNLPLPVQVPILNP